MMRTLLGMQELMLLLLIIIPWLAMSLLVAWAASVRGRSSVVWLILSITLSPLFAALVLIAAGSTTDAERE